MAVYSCLDCNITFRPDSSLACPQCKQVDNVVRREDNGKNRRSKRPKHIHV